MKKTRRDGLSERETHHRAARTNDRFRKGSTRPTSYACCALHRVCFGARRAGAVLAGFPSRNRPDLSSRVPCVAFRAARFNAASAFSKSSPRRMPTIPRVDKIKRAFSAGPDIPLIDNRSVNGLEVGPTSSKSAADRILRNAVPAGSAPACGRVGAIPRRNPDADKLKRPDIQAPAKPEFFARRSDLQALSQ